MNNISFQQRTLIEIIISINKENFFDKLMKEVTPHFASNRLKLTSNVSEINLLQIDSN